MANMTAGVFITGYQPFYDLPALKHMNINVVYPLEINYGGR